MPFFIIIFSPCQQMTICFTATALFSDGLGVSHSSFVIVVYEQGQNFITAIYAIHAAGI